MKKFLAMTVMSLAATSAMAGVKLVVRSDYVNTADYKDASDANISGTSLFKPEVARLYLSGMVGDATVDAGLNLRSFIVSGSQKVMTVDKFVEHLTITKPMGDWSFQAGKMWMNVGGFERRAVYDGDTYLTSLANGGVGGYATAGDATSLLRGTQVTPENMSGMGAAYTINADHKLEFQLANQTNSDSELTTATNRRHTMGLAYWGSFAEKMLQTYISYTSGAADVAGAGHDQTFLGAGFRIAPMENLRVDLEYLANTDSDATPTTGKKDETTSTLVEVRYTTGMYTPLFKYEMSSDKKDGDNMFKRNAWALGLEIVPKAEDAFRYHVAYTSIVDKNDSTTPNLKDVTQGLITLGFKYNGDIAN